MSRTATVQEVQDLLRDGTISEKFERAGLNEIQLMIPTDGLKLRVQASVPHGKIPDLVRYVGSDSLLEFRLNEETVIVKFQVMDNYEE